MANDYVDHVLEWVHNYVVENELQAIDIPNINQTFEQDVSQAHTQITEE